MKARRTIFSNAVYRLLGGTEDNDLWVRRTEHAIDGAPVIESVWEPTDEERAAIADGSNLYLLVWGDGHPPVAIGVTDVPLGKAPAEEPA